MEAVAENGQPNELDRIEAEAAAMSAPQQEEQPGPGPAAPAPFQQPAGAFDHTHEIIVVGIQGLLRAHPGGEEAGKVWESPFFKSAVVPFMMKYNISVHNLPVELVLLGAIAMLAKESAGIIRAATEKQNAEAAAPEKAD